MWTRADLKMRAKKTLMKYYWAAFVVSLICAILGGSGGGSGASLSAGGGSGNTESDYYVEDFYSSPSVPEMEGGSGFIREDGNGISDFSGLDKMILTTVIGVMIVVFLILIALAVFITSAIEVGKNRFFMESRSLGKSAGVGKITWGFSNKYLKIVKTMFVKDLIVEGLPTVLIIAGGVTFLISVLSLSAIEYSDSSMMVTTGVFVLFFVMIFAASIWAIYFSYCYLMVPYILSENPDIGVKEALRLSKEMMKGHKFNTWVLGLSFIGWELLGLLACGIGILFVMPYIHATFAELYAVLRQPYADRLAGFGMPEVLPAGEAYGTYVDPLSGGQSYEPYGGYSGQNSEPYGESGGQNYSPYGGTDGQGYDSYGETGGQNQSGNDETNK